MTIAILKYNAGNSRSVALALHRLGVEAVLTDDPLVLRDAEKVIIPGVGAARSAMEYLSKRGLTEVICSLSQPVLGICLGQQIFCERSEEEDTPCLGIFPLPVEYFKTPKKIPHMGWNALSGLSGPLFEGLPEQPYTYFVHSYRVPPSSFTIATCEHGEQFSAAIHKDNFYALQFHPERSGAVGQRILQNFIAL